VTFLFNAGDYPVEIQRQGVPTTRPAQAHILKWLYDPSLRPVEQPFKTIDMKFLGLSYKSKPSIKTLEKRDWIIASTKVFAETRYQITSRGIAALKIINLSGPQHHADELCSNCRQHPRKRYPSRLDTYCQACINQKRRKARAFKGNQLDPFKLCARCRDQKRHTTPSGRVDVYCRSCRNAMYREHTRQQMEAVRTTGNTQSCCDCQSAIVYVTQGRVYRRCETCQKRLWGEADARRPSRKISRLSRRLRPVEGD